MNNNERIPNFIWEITEEKGFDNANSWIINRNLRGEKQAPFNPQGRRNFTVRLPEDTARTLASYGWNVKIKEDRLNPDDELFGYLQVEARFDKVPPSIWEVVTRSNGTQKRIPYSEGKIALIDNASIKNVRLEITPSRWDNGINSGVKAYLKTMYFELVPDAFSNSYNFDDSDDSDEMPFEI